MRKKIPGSVKIAAIVIATALVTYFECHRNDIDVENVWESSADSTQVAENIKITNGSWSGSGIKEIALYSSPPGRSIFHETWCFQESDDYVFGYNREIVEYVKRDADGRQLFDAERLKVEGGYYFILRKQDGSGSLFLSRASFLAALRFSLGEAADHIAMRPEERCSIEKLQEIFLSRTPSGTLLFPHVRFFDGANVDHYVVP